MLFRSRKILFIHRKNMAFKEIVGMCAFAVLIGGCATPSATQPASESASGSQSQAKAAVPEGTVSEEPRIVKSRNGTFEGEIYGTPAPQSKFAKLKIGMAMREVTHLIGAPDDMFHHETGKRWIPFYFGNDAQRIQVFYKGEGCLTFTGGNVFGGGGNELITITVDKDGTCLDS